MQRTCTAFRRALLHPTPGAWGIVDVKMEFGQPGNAEDRTLVAVPERR